jgi:hypothetical protein
MTVESGDQVAFLTNPVLKEKNELMILKSILTYIQSDLDTTRGSGVPDFEKFSAYNGGPRSKEVDRILAPSFT